jgi:hypothetical protein
MTLKNTRKQALFLVHPPATIHEFENEGVALEELITCVAKSLMNNGTFDEQCEEHIAAYR